MEITTLVEPRLKLSDEEFKAIRDLIYEKSGLFFTYKKKYFLKSKLDERLKALNLKSYNEYRYFLKHNPRRLKELSSLFDLITISETSFFRDPAQLQALETKVLPGIIERKKKDGSLRISIWSAGCSTGEEPYTLAIIVLETLKRATQKWNVEILGNDISEASLQVARQGVYSEYTMRNVPPNLRLKYFSSTEKGYAVDETVKKLVRFSNINLFDQKMLKRIQGQDIIFCRNVLIYFDEKAKRQVVASLYDILNPGGYLFIGHSESLHRISNAFKLIHFTRAIGYKKE